MSSKSLQFLVFTVVTCTTLLAVSALGEPVAAPPINANSLLEDRRVHFKFGSKLYLMLHRKQGAFPKQAVLDSAIATNKITATYSRKPFVAKGEDGTLYLVTSAPTAWSVVEAKVLPKLTITGTGSSRKVQVKNRCRLQVKLQTVRPVETSEEITPEVSPAGKAEIKAPSEVIAPAAALDSGDEELEITIDPSIDPELIEIPVDVEPYPDYYDPCSDSSGP